MGSFRPDPVGSARGIATMKQRGFTLVELLVAMVVSGIAMTMVWTLWQGFHRHFWDRAYSDQDKAFAQIRAVEQSWLQSCGLVAVGEQYLEWRSCRTEQIRSLRWEDQELWLDARLLPIKDLVDWSLQVNPQLSDQQNWMHWDQDFDEILRGNELDSVGLLYIHWTFENHPEIQSVWYPRGR